MVRAHEPKRRALQAQSIHSPEIQHFASCHSSVALTTYYHLSKWSTKLHQPHQSISQSSSKLIVFISLFRADRRYWGKRDTKLILPTNSSLSVTLDQDHLRSTTTSRADESFEEGDKLWLNGKDDPIKEGGRLWVCIKELRAWRKEMEEKDSSLPKVSSLCGVKKRF